MQLSHFELLLFQVEGTAVVVGHQGQVNGCVTDVVVQWLNHLNSEFTLRLDLLIQRFLLHWRLTSINLLVIS